MQSNGNQLSVNVDERNKMDAEAPVNPTFNMRFMERKPIQICCKLSTSLMQLFFPSWTFFNFFAHAAIPALADNLVPLFFIGNIPDQSALALAGQFTFVSVIVEVIQEGIVNSLFFYVGRNYIPNRMKALQAFKISLVFLFCLGAVLTIFMICFTPQFVNVIDTPESIVESSRTFLYISSFSLPLLLLNAGFSNYLLITTSSYLIFAQFSNVTLTFLSNFFLFGQQKFSLQWNVDQLGYYKIIQSFLSCTNSFVFCLIIEKLGPINFIFKVPFANEFKSHFLELFNVSWGNFGDSAVRNFFYFVVTLKFINNLGETEVAAWNLLNSIVWGLLLIPSFAVANYAKVKIGHHGTKSVVKKIGVKSLRCLLVWMSLVVLLTALYWPKMTSFFGKTNESAQNLSTELLYNMGWIFIIFSFNNAMDSLFFGIGKTQYVFYQSLFTNLIVYFIPWILYLCNVIQPTYWLVVGLYVGGMLVDFCLTAYFCCRVWKIMVEY